MYTMNDAYSDVKLFNTLAGNLKDVKLESIDAQLGFCFEELEEAITSLEEKDMRNLVKEVCDMFVTTAGMIQKLQAAGVDMELALQVVNENNLTKFPKTMSESNIERSEELGYKVEYNAQYSRFMLKDSVGKVKKPPNYVQADMSSISLGSLA